jgi:hypothetical protein
MAEERPSQAIAGPP